MNAASRPLGGVMHAVSHTEITPPAYFLFQHEWLLRAGSRSEWVARLPSVVCGVALVAVVYWLALLLSDSAWVVLGSAALAAISPFVLDYAQRAQGYLFAAMAVTTSVCAVFASERSLRRGQAWLTLAGVSAALAMCINYTAIVATAMLCAWVASRAAFSLRWRRTFIAACALVALILLPLFVIQWHNTPGRHGVGSGADLTLTNIGRIARAPFDGRAGSLAELGVVVTIGPLLALVFGRARLARQWLLVLALAVGEPLLLLLLSAFGARVALTRYAAVAVPFLIVAMAAGVALMPRWVALSTAAAVLVAAGAGLSASHRQSGFYADARGVVDYVQAHRQTTDIVLSPTSPAIAVPLAYYGLHRLTPVLTYAFAGSREASTLLSERRVVWVVSPLARSGVDARQLIELERPLAARFGYRATTGAIFPSSAPLGVVRWSPTDPRRP